MSSSCCWRSASSAAWSCCHSVLQFLDGDLLGVLHLSKAMLQDGQFVAQLRLSLGSVFHIHLQHDSSLARATLVLRCRCRGGAAVTGLTPYRKW